MTRLACSRHVDGVDPQLVGQVLQLGHLAVVVISIEARILFAENILIQDLILGWGGHISKELAVEPFLKN